SLSDTVATFNAFSGLKTKKGWSRLGADSPIEALGDRHTFLEVFTAIIDGVRSNRIDIAEHPKGEPRLRYYLGKNPIDIRITLHRPSCHAVVSFFATTSVSTTDEERLIERRGYLGSSAAKSGSETINMERTLTIDDRAIYALSCRLDDRELKSREELQHEMRM